MSYLVLARKYRPKDFDSLIGQDHVVRALTHALENQRLHHAYLFSGTRGVGKTTLARILAKAFNCETGITASPCGVCEPCLAITADRFVDYIEMDGASNRGIGDMLQLLEQAIYSPSSARFKIYMIDEVHMLTQQAFNAMLKTLEEPPDYVKFILATTDPQKIPVTVLSRCLQFNLKQMPPQQIVEYLGHVLEQEKINFEKPALRLLAEGAGGSMRDALSLADQAISFTAGHVTLSAVTDMLGSLDQTYLVRILDALAARDGAKLVSISDELALRSLSFHAALKELGVLLNRIALAQTASGALPEDLPEYEDILGFAAAFDAEDVQLFYQIAVHGRNELGLAPDEYAGFTMTLLRMLAFAPEREPRPTGREPRPSPAHRPPPPPSAARPASSSGREEKVFPAPARPSAATADADTQNAAPLLNQVAEEPAVRSNEDMFLKMAHEPVLENQTQSGLFQEQMIQEKTAEEKEAAPVTVKIEWDENWPALAQALDLKGPAQQLAEQTEMVSCRQAGGSLHFHLRTSMELLCAPANVEKLSEALMNRFECEVKVTTEIGKVGLTASQFAQDQRMSRQKDAELMMENDPYMQSLLATFGASIVPNSIKPI